jgi:hypothetical protein
MMEFLVSERPFGWLVKISFAFLLILISLLFIIFCNTCSAPAISSRAHKSSLQSPSGDSTSKSAWKSYSNGERSTAPEFDDNTSLVGAAPLLKSFVTQVSN